jgi:hypothetical protein
MSETTAVTRMDATANIELFERQKKLAVDLAKSDLLPGNYRGKPANVLVALRRAATLELDPFFFMENTAVINGKLTMHSDGPLAVVRARAGSELAHFKEHWDEETKTATCEVQRRGQPMIVHTFSVADAETAGLFSRGDTWKKYPKRMCQMRARGYALRDGFADFLGGLQQAEALDEIVEPADFTESEKPSGADVLRSAMQKQSDEPEISDAEVVEQTPAEAAQEVVEACSEVFGAEGEERELAMDRADSLFADDVPESEPVAKQSAAVADYPDGMRTKPATVEQRKDAQQEPSRDELLAEVLRETKELHPNSDGRAYAGLFSELIGRRITKRDDLTRGDLLLILDAYKDAKR